MNDFTPADHATFEQMRAKMDPLDIRSINAIIAVAIGIRAERQHQRVSHVFYEMAEAAKQLEAQTGGLANGEFKTE